jgi:YbbR domain-containing protein
MRLPAPVRANPGPKLLSLALALLLWSFVHGAKVVEREYTIPLQFGSLPDSLLFLEPPPRQMRVLVSGPAQDLLLRLRLMRDVSAHIDLSGATPQLDRVVPSLSDISSPGNKDVSIVRILSPSVIAFRLAVRAERDLPVRVVMRAAAASSWCLADSPTVKPVRVRCIGAKPLLEQMADVATVPIDVPGRRGHFTQAVELVSDGERLQCVPERIDVTFDTERLRRRALPDAPLTVVPPAAAGLWATTEVQSAEVTVAGPERRIEALDVAEVGLFVDASRLHAGRHDSIPVIAQVPPWARVVDLDPASVPVTVRRDPNMSRSRSRRAAASRPELP